MSNGYSGRVAYGKTIADAWKSLWKSFALWGVTGLGFLVFALLIAVTLGGAWALGLFNVNMDQPESMLAMMAAIYGGMAITGLVGGFLYIGVHGGATWVADELLSGRKPTVGDGLKYGFTRWPRTLGFELLFGGTMWLIYVIVFGALFGLVIGLSAVSGDAGGVVVLFGVCFMYALLLVGVPLCATVVISSEALGLRTALLADTGAIEAYKQVWRTFRSGFKQLFIMGLLFMGLMYAYQMISSAVTAPVYFIFMGDAYANMFQMMETPAAADPEAMLGPVYSSMGGMYTVMFVLSAVLMWPMMTFVYPLMGSFYRQISGIEPPPARQQPQAYAQQHYAGYQQVPTGQQQPPSPPPPVPSDQSPAQPAGPLPVPPQPRGPLPAPPTSPRTQPPASSDEEQ